MANEFVAKNGLIVSGSTYVSESLYLGGALFDSTGNSGSLGQVLSSVAGGTDWINIIDLTGSVDGSGSANQVAYWFDPNTITGSANLQFDGTTLTAANDAVINGVCVGNGGGDISSNTRLGGSALCSNTTGTFNTAVGAYALRNNTTGTSNVAVVI
jgi:hypothetical protein